MDVQQISQMQQTLCDTYGVSYEEVDWKLRVGVPDNVKDSLTQPINALRHPPEGITTGWYIWRGETFSEEADFFKPACIEHLIELCPKLVKYFALPAGYRVLIDDDGYEDVWTDPTLLTI